MGSEESIHRRPDAPPFLPTRERAEAVGFAFVRTQAPTLQVRPRVFGQAGDGDELAERRPDVSRGARAGRVRTAGLAWPRRGGGIRKLAGQSAGGLMGLDPPDEGGGVTFEK